MKAIVHWLHAKLLLGSLFLALNTEVERFSEMSINVYQTTRRHVLEDNAIHTTWRVSNTLADFLSNFSNCVCVFWAVCTGFIRIRTITTDQWRTLADTVCTKKIRGNSRVAAQLAATQQGLSSMKLLTAAWCMGGETRSIVRLLHTHARQKQMADRAAKPVATTEPQTGWLPTKPASQTNSR
jgi:D-alanyl-lipoteichoic acid acyltransferase DltB (MBOAT superfamily)